MKILTWNISHYSSYNLWKYVFDKLRPDVAFLQEAYHPLTYVDEDIFKSLKDKFIWESTKMRWGNLIVTKNMKIEHILLEHEFKGRLIVGYIPDIGINVVNMHVPITKGYSRHDLQAMFKIISKYLANRPSIVAGDLNFGECFDNNGKTEHKDIMNTILNENNLVNAYKLFHEQEKQTFKPVRKPESNIHSDYIFVSKDLANRLKECRIIDTQMLPFYSDHYPVSIALDSLS